MTSSSSTNPSGAGGVFRNLKRFLLACFSFHIRSSLAYVAELRAAIYAIKKAWERGWHHLWIECDSTYVVNVLKSRATEVPWVVFVKWSNCRILLKQWTSLLLIYT